jgi:hypothetical protein
LGREHGVRRSMLLLVLAAPRLSDLPHSALTLEI